MSSQQQRYTKMRTTLSIISLSLVLFSSANPSAALTQNEIAGTWTLVSIVHEEQSGKKSTPLGEHPRGILVIGQDGRFTAVLVAQGRTPPQNEGSMAELTQSLIAYSATATISPNSGPSSLKVTLRPDVSWNPGTTGNSDDRVVTVEGNRLILKSTSAGGSETQVYERTSR